MDSPQRICLLGSTGSVGEKTLQVARDHPDRFRIVGLSAHASEARLLEQVAEFRPEAACLSGRSEAPSVNGAARWLAGAEGLVELIDACAPDRVVVATVGAAGLMPTLRAIESDASVALANKEVLVTAGELVMALARRRGTTILPIDSEHNAIFQCLEGRPEAPVRRLILTASGGPFRGWPRERLERATAADALRHPTWAMGRKITIDSATMMNKGFEMIEAHHLFGVAPGRIEIVVHPQSVVHSMVEFIDGSMLAQLGRTDMYFPIVHALAHPDRLANSRFEALDLAALGSLDFEDYDRAAFPCPDYAHEAIRRGGTFPAALNAANEIAVARFLAGEIRFTAVAEVVDAVLQAHESTGAADLESIRAADAWARDEARAMTAARA